MATAYIDTFGNALWTIKRVQRGSISDIWNLCYMRLTLCKWVMARTYIDTFGRALWMLKRVYAWFCQGDLESKVWTSNMI